MLIDCVSDLHGHYPELEGGDLLIVAGDLTAREKPEEYLYFQTWLADQNYKKKIVIAGNHDNRLTKIDGFGLSVLLGNCDYLCDSGTEFETFGDGKPEWGSSRVLNGSYFKQTTKLKIWGSPWTKRFEGMNPHCMAFTVDTEEELMKKWELIPYDTDILITHSPPYGIKDKTVDGRFVGSETLSSYVGGMKPPPKLWVWGHIHESYGRDMVIRGADCIMLNASHVNEHYKPVNKPIRVEL